MLVLRPVIIIKARNVAVLSMDHKCSFQTDIVKRSCRY